MSEPAALPYIVRDYCATCGERLVQLEHGGKVTCHQNEAQYWSEVEPLPADARGHFQLTGLTPRIQTEWYDAQTGMRFTHRPLWLYRSVA